MKPITGETAGCAKAACGPIAVTPRPAIKSRRLIEPPPRMAFGDDLIITGAIRLAGFAASRPLWVKHRLRPARLGASATGQTDGCAAEAPALFDHLVGTCKQCRGQAKAE